MYYIIFNLLTKQDADSWRVQDLLSASGGGPWLFFFSPSAAKQSLLSGVHYNVVALTRPAGGIHHALHPSSAEPWLWNIFAGLHLQRYAGLNWWDKYRRLRSAAPQRCCIHQPGWRLTTRSARPARQPVSAPSAIREQWEISCAGAAPENVNRVRAEVAKVRRLCSETPICLHITKILCKRVMAKVVHTETPRRGKSQQQQTTIDQDGGKK